jgi:hypothetical protein
MQDGKRQDGGGYSRIPGMSSEQTGLFGTGRHCTTKHNLSCPAPNAKRKKEKEEKITITMTGEISGGISDPCKASCSSLDPLPKHTVYRPDLKALPPRL